MNSSERRGHASDFLSASFVSVPFEWIARFTELGLTPDEFMVLLQILAAAQVQHKELLSPQELGDACGMSADAAGTLVSGLVSKGVLAIGERSDENGSQCNFFDLSPLWEKLQGAPEPTPEPKRLDPVSLFEAEFGRPLSGFECEQIRQWMERDEHPEWLIVEALREAVLTNKYSFKYIDRVLYDWQRNRIRTKQELENYRQSFRDRAKAREEAAAGLQSNTKRSASAARTSTRTPNQETRDERYAAFYQLFPES
ncbi:DnaD domain protein [Alicyclobacillus cycloheptanicus]|uniref:DNA replication protein n=1 Tax=Alicyclobacillus cycloheptanicus TaxID=1457 RepID=A0ABT9XEM9_9BACL|nr:DnaD domain protein [Alicyclobacillus cycloheptanicus]MDQ0188585.1 DNA replication protein [Alicyclobacillus cycloheptanicus]WDM01266.1 DnaD domain protein [Alicyclobacillus cycloheptanicus]